MESQLFNERYDELEAKLKGYLFRLLTNRQDVEDFYHNTYLKAFERRSTFKGEPSQFKNWIFTIATRIVFNHLKREKIWHENAQDKCRNNLTNNKDERKAFLSAIDRETINSYDIKEHIDFCFTCLNKTLPIDKQVALLLKSVFEFKLNEVSEIMDKSEGQVKHLLVDARKEMNDIFSGRCALINQKGPCHQCSELQGLFNPKVDAKPIIEDLEMVKSANSDPSSPLFELRTKIINNLNPFDSQKENIHEHLMNHMKKVNNL